MNRIRLIRLLCVMAVFGLAMGGVAKANMSSATVLANTCFSCHGADGKSVGAMPSLAGKPAKYIAATMKAFRDGRKKGTVMNRIAKGFTADEIAALARFFSGKK